ncbi:cytochrome P450 [Spongiactinospora sp. TRM90649]|uniref:cytochrome P450 n=1 Tax=Spongiactinospora sp. TRM90649 TaxID=3031114 RepID=UPI0023F7EB46|nr:cytochrome P450 [Spongiactinospora sp. TRM90649]MDF5752027.1 cytochrome P450 [Spongiactinospora sp. TRM90649]
MVREPVATLDGIGKEAGDEIVQLNLGTFRPYLVTSPDHVQRVLTDSGRFVRAGVFWKPLRRLFGEGSIMSEGATWSSSRRTLQPMFTPRYVGTLADSMADSVAEAVEEMSRRTASGDPIDAATELTKLVSGILIRDFFGDTISMRDADELMAALDTMATAVVIRIMLPVMPDWVPLPGDAALRRVVRTFDALAAPLIRKYSVTPSQGDDILSALCRAWNQDGGRTLPKNWVRDNLVTMFAVGTETAIMALTWFWPALAGHPEVIAKLHEEVTRVTGGDRIRGSHLPDLVYTKMVMQEVLRLYPTGWVFVRTVVEPTVVGDVTLKAGRSVILSPYLTHRLESAFERPLVFDPERFTPERARLRHKFAYMPFGGGQHQCMGMHVFYQEAMLIIAGIMSRFRPALADPAPVTPEVAVTLRPAQQVRLTLTPFEPQGAR